MGGIPIGQIERRQLENMVLFQQGLIRDLLKSVRDNTKPEWKWRKDVETRVERFRSKALDPFRDVEWERRQQSIQRERLDEYWDMVTSVAGTTPEPAPVPTHRPTLLSFEG